MITMSSEMNTESILGMIIALFTVGVFLWRVIVYFYNKSKCFNSTIETNKQLVKSMASMELQIIEVEKGFETLKDEIKDDFNRERHDGTAVHKEIFERLTNIDKNLAFMSGQKSINIKKEVSTS